MSHNYTYSNDNPNNYTLDYQPSHVRNQQKQNQSNSPDEQNHNINDYNNDINIDDGNNNSGVYHDSVRNQHSSQTLNTQQRRPYPKDEKLRKNEWEAMELHKLEIINQLAKSEEEIKNYRKQEFLSELDRRVLAKLEEKRDLLQQQKEDAIKSQQDFEKFQQQTKQGKHDRKMLERLMGDYYSQQLNHKSSKEMEEKQQKLRWEQSLLDYNRQKLESEEIRKRQQKQFMSYERQSDLERAKFNKNLQKQRDDRAIQEYRNYMKKNEENQKNKEMGYKNFYEITSMNQDKKQLEYFEHVGKQNLERQRQQDDVIDKNVQQEQIRRQQDEQNRMMNQKRNNLIQRDDNLSLINEKRQFQDNQKHQQQQMVNERLSDLDKYNQYQQYKKQEKLENQNSYKYDLDQMLQEKTKLQQNALRMTKQEKGINREDLQAYKQYDNGLYSLIPGYSLQIGQLPPKENRERMQQRYQQTIREQGVSQAESNWKQSYDQQMAREQNKQNIARQSMANLKQFQKIGEPLQKYNQSMVLERQQEPIKSRVPENLIYGHNPITNPMPINVQNPYLAKEFDRASNANRGRYFQQIGENLSSAQA